MYAYRSIFFPIVQTEATGNIAENKRPYEAQKAVGVVGSFCVPMDGDAKGDLVQPALFLHRKGQCDLLLPHLINVGQIGDGACNSTGAVQGPSAGSA